METAVAYYVVLTNDLMDRILDSGILDNPNSTKNPDEVIYIKMLIDTLKTFKIKEV